MKKINFKKIGIIVLWFLGVSGLVVTLGFVNNREALVKGKTITVNINQNDENSFVDEDDVLKFLQDRHDTLIGKPMSEINVYELEKSLNAHPSIANSEVAVSVSGDVTINITQRKPIVRVINTQGESFYLDNKATLMPLADHYTARVLVVNGIITESYSQFYNFSIPQIEKDSALSKATVLDDIYEVVSYINKDSLLSGLVTQMYINTDREIELYPAVGNQKIIFGDASCIADKFEKLKTFYREGLNSINNWNKYTTINLKYKNQVVCTKKESGEKMNKITPAPVVIVEKKKEEPEKKEQIVEKETGKPVLNEAPKENNKGNEIEKKSKPEEKNKEAKNKDENNSKPVENKKKKSEDLKKSPNKKDKIKK